MMSINRTRSRFSDDAKAIMKHVHDFCKDEKESGIMISLNKPMERTTALTGVSKSTILRISKGNEATSTQKKLARFERFRPKLEIKKYL